MTETKASIRKHLLRKRLQLTEKEVRSFSKRILNRLTKTDQFKKARTILLYSPIKNEVDPTPLFEKYATEATGTTKKTFALIRVCKNNRIHIHKITDLNTLQTGRFNIKEPTSKHPKITRREDLDLIITPGLAFDPNGHRIGYGKGYFDKLFKNLSTKSAKCAKVALAYDFQIIENIPADKHDQKVDLIITEKRIVRPHKQTT